MGFLDKIFNRNKGEQNIKEEYSFQRQYGLGVSQIVLTRKLDENNEPQSLDFDNGKSLAIYIIERAPEVEVREGQQPEIYLDFEIDSERLNTDDIYRKSISRLLSPDRVQKAYNEYGGYVGGIDDQYLQQDSVIGNHYQIVEPDISLVRAIQLYGHSKTANLTDHCKKNGRFYYYA